MYAALSGTKPEDAHYQNQMAATYLQKMRETMDPDYLNRAAKIVDAVLSNDRVNYEALRLRSAIELERHDFPRAAANSRELTASLPKTRGITARWATPSWNSANTAPLPTPTRRWCNSVPTCPATTALPTTAS